MVGTLTLLWYVKGYRVTENDWLAGLVKVLKSKEDLVTVID